MTRRTTAPVAALLACLVGLETASADDLHNEIPDAMITDKIEDELKLDPSVDATHLDITTHEGIATLKGTVPHLLARDRAVEVARTVRGVRGILDRVKVEPKLRTDIAIRQDIHEALLRDPVTESYEVEVTVDHGVATLSGKVDSFPEKRIAGRVAKGVVGLRDVKNDLEVRLVTSRTDYEIRQDIMGSLRWDALIDHGLIGVTVTQGDVKLTGAVGSAAEKRRAEFKAFVAGVRSINSQELKVTAWARDTRMRSKKYIGYTDEQVAGAIQDGFFYDPRVLSSAVKVELDDGVATLRGTVESLKARRSAAQIARDTVGVSRVVNRLKVRPEAVKAALLRQRVREALIRDPYVSPFEVTVEVDRGVVTLTGEVDSYFERGQADDAASRIEGVVLVKNRLTIERDWPVLTYDPYVRYDWYLYDHDWYRPPTPLTFKSDEEILADIKSELWWSPYVDEEDVIVTVEDGVATLKGSVSTYSEWLAARENAREGGAVRLKDRLTIVSDQRLLERSD